jgi:hypothetical protein
MCRKIKQKKENKKLGHEIRWKKKLRENVLPLDYAQSPFS